MIHSPSSLLQQSDVTAQRQAERSTAFVAPTEPAELTIEEKRAAKKSAKRKHAETEEPSAPVEAESGGKAEKTKKKKRKDKDGDVAMADA